MKQFPKIIFVAIAAMLVLWVLPWLLGLMSVSPSRTPFTLYSTVVGDFAMVRYDGKKTCYSDLAGNSYSEAQFDSILPLFYYRQLVADERFPDSLNGIAITPKMVQSETFFFRISPTTVNSVKLPLYQLMESMPSRVDLEMPSDVFRLGTGIEFVDMASNSINEAKSRRYAEMLTDKGFVFPAQVVAGNPTTKKEYDEGYLVTDSRGELFHLKQTVGRPYVRHIGKPADVCIEHIFVTEFSNRRSLAFIVDSNSRFWVLTSKSYEFMQVQIPPFNPCTMGMSLIANMFDWTVSIDDGKAERIFAIDANTLELVKQMEHSYGDSSWIRRNIPALEFTSYNEYSVFPRLKCGR